MRDIDYLRSVIARLSQTQHYSVENMSSAKGLIIGLTDDMKRCWKNTFPKEAIPEDGSLCRLNQRSNLPTRIASKRQ